VKKNRTKAAVRRASAAGRRWRVAAGTSEGATAEAGGSWNRTEAGSIPELAGNYRVFKMIDGQRIDGGGLPGFLAAAPRALSCLRIIRRGRRERSRARGIRGRGAGLGSAFGRG